MKVTVVVDNIGNEKAKGEWGLCLHIEHNGKSILLDTGASDLFAENMKALGLDIKDIDIAVLSHAHSDHANGMPGFFESNKKADFYIQQSCSEDCYLKIGLFRSYQGIPAGTLSKYAGRIKQVNENTEIADDIFIICHDKADKPAGKAQHLFIKKENKLVPDDFSHEQSLVIRTDKGLVIFNSCSHTGAPSIIREVRRAFPDEKIYAYMGGLHLVAMPEKYIREIASGLEKSGIEKIYTGHCTKEKGFRILRKELGSRVEQFNVGMEIEL